MFFYKTCRKILVAFVIGSELLSELKLSTVTSKTENCPEGLLQGLLLFCSNLQANQNKEKIDNSRSQKYYEVDKNIGHG